MTRRLLITTLTAGAVIFLLVLLLFGEELNSASFLPVSVSTDILNFFSDKETQWLLFLCCGVYFLAFVYLRFYSASASFWRDDNPCAWLSGVLLANAAVYLLKYSGSTDALMLLGGAALGQGIALGAAWRGQRRTGLVMAAWISPLILALLTVASMMDSFAHRHVFVYRGQERWTGPWDGPNIYGLLMGVGMVLAGGQIVQRIMFKVNSQELEDNRKIRGWNPAVGILCVLAAIPLGWGLLQSYSRGAWLATFCGFVYLACSIKVQSLKLKIRSDWLLKNRIPLFVIMVALVVLSFWQFQHTETLPIRRVFSVANENDFSWRNRVSAWNGALQMMADRPWFGFGWNQPESIYQYHYQTSIAGGGMAILMNDYFMLGTTLGIPALFCFALYIWLSLVQTPRNRRFLADPASSEWPQAVCRAAAIVLLIGFGFDGGLFKLPTASMFWILLESGVV